MAIELTSPVVRPSSTEARISGIVIDLPRRTADIHVQIGHHESGVWTVDRVQPVQFVDDEATGQNGFTLLVQGVPEFKALRRALEDYLSARNIYSGTVS